MSTATDIGTLIIHKRTLDGSRACVNCGVSVKTIVIRHLKMGMTPREIIEDNDLITMEQFHAALAYYYANKEEIEFEIAEDERVWRENTGE